MDCRHNPSATDALIALSQKPSHSPTVKQSPGCFSSQYIGHPDKLLTTDLSHLYGDADKLYKFAGSLQQLCLELQTKVDKLNAKTNLTNSQSKGSSRKDTDDSQNSDYSLKKGLQEPSIGVAITYDHSDFRLAVRSMDAMKANKGLKYTKTELPPYHLWTDTLHIYSAINIDRKTSGSGFKVVKKKLSPQDPDYYNYRFMRTLKLGQLGFGIIRKRWNGTLKTIYVLSPESQPAVSPEMRMCTEPAAMR